MRGWLGARSQFDYGDEDVAEDEMNAADEMREKAAQQLAKEIVAVGRPYLEDCDILGMNDSGWKAKMPKLPQWLSICAKAKRLIDSPIRSLPTEGTEPRDICPHTWSEGKKAYGCVLPVGHQGDHSPYAQRLKGLCQTKIHGEHHEHWQAPDCVNWRPLITKPESQL